jgi:hypothetical protein
MSATPSALPKKIVDQMFEDHGKNTNSWPTELQDLVNPSIEALQLSPPLSGQIATRLNRDFEYYWARDIGGATPDHSRVGAMKYDGWDFATTEDVKMCNEDTVKGRNKSGFSNEIRNGDLILMKIPKMKWRQMRKAQNLEAIRMAYPQGFGQDGAPMSSANLTPGIRTNVMSEAEIDSMRAGARVSDPKQEVLTGDIRGNAAVANIQDR